MGLDDKIKHTAEDLAGGGAKCPSALRGVSARLLRPSAVASVRSGHFSLIGSTTAWCAGKVTGMQGAPAIRSSGAPVGGDRCATWIAA